MTTRARYVVTCDGMDVAYAKHLDDRKAIVQACIYEGRLEVTPEGAERSALKDGFTYQDINGQKVALCPKCTEGLGFAR